MSDEENWLLSARFRALAGRLDSGIAREEADALWRSAQEAVDAAGAKEDADVALPVLARDASELRTLVAAWDARRIQLPSWDQSVLKRALKAFRRRLDLTRSGDEFSSSRNPLSKGASSSITGVRPPDRYPQEVWDLLIAQGKLRDTGDGVLELTTG